MPPIISIVGKSESGKTTLIVKLVSELKKRGYKIGTLKHAAHGFDMDKNGKDSARHKKAGADAVMVAAPDGFAFLKDTAATNIDSLAPYFSDMDLLLTEGYKREKKQKIEIFRKSRHREPLCLDDPNLIAFITDTDLTANVPKFGLDDITEIADFIENRFLRKTD